MHINMPTLFLFGINKNNRFNLKLILYLCPMKTKSAYIHLNKMQFYAYHGVAQQENKIGNTFYVSLRLKIKLNASFQTDNVEDTLSYADVYEAVKKEMQTTSKLLEHVCQRITQQLYCQFECIEEIKVKVVKETPPMGGLIDEVGVQLDSTRE
jgi:dihydroneopterin aldolase